MAKLHDFQRPSARQIRDADLFFDDLIGRTRGREALTEQVGPSAATVTPFMILDRLAFDSDDFLADHRAGITRVAHLIVDSVGSGAPITSVRIVGHTDSQGQATHNNGLGRRRATKVAAFLRTEIDRFRAGTSSSITITPDTEGSRRLRPILMTALATIFALLPLALGLTGSGGFISQPLALVVIGGLFSSTLLTLLVLPSLYDLVEGGRERRRAKRAAKRDEAASDSPPAVGAGATRGDAGAASSELPPDAR
jgi:hypothetical protein